MILYRTQNGLLVEESGRYYSVEEASLDALISLDDLYLHLSSIVASTTPVELPESPAFEAPIENQEVWAAGVTYYRSRAARIEESKDAGGGDFYDRVYSADRPELFFKAVAHKVAGPDSEVRIRRGPRGDSHSGSFGGGIANPVNVLAKMIASLHDDAWSRHPAAGASTHACRGRRAHPAAAGGDRRASPLR